MDESGEFSFGALAAAMERRWEQSGKDLHQAIVELAVEQGGPELRDKILAIKDPEDVLPYTGALVELMRVCPAAMVDARLKEIASGRGSQGIETERGSIDSSHIFRRGL